MEVGWEEYLVFGLMLCVSVAIGIFYGCFGSKQKSTKEFLLGNQTMSAFPVALSQICTAISAITLLAHPVEVYLYGLQYILITLSLVPFTLSLVYIYIPVYFNLEVKSAYEYIEIRFSANVRLVISLVAVFHVIVSMAIAIYAPALAIKQVTGLSTEVSTAIIYFVCILYSALGGLKAVLWTDVFQGFIMLASLLAIAAKGLSDLGGFGVLWERASDAGRLHVLNFDPDLRTRHTVWTCIIAGYFFWIPSYAATQVQVQRFLAMPDMKTVKRCLLINMIGLAIVILACMLTGLILVAKYYDCDPISTKEIEKSDQLVPYFVMETVKGVPTLLGLFIAGLTCASMSSLSSGLTALASITTYDYVKKMFPNLTDFKLSTISKFSTLILGLVSYCFVFVIQNMGSILPVTSSFIGIMLGPTFGLFSLAMLFPYANAKGSLTGLIVTFILMITHVILNNLNSSSLPDQRLPLSSECSSQDTNVTTIMPDAVNMRSTGSDDWKHGDDSFYIQLLSISYMWYSAAGCILSVFLGLVCSVFIRLVEGNTTKKVPAEYLSPPILNLYVRLFPNHIRNWVDFKNKIIVNDDVNVDS